MEWNEGSAYLLLRSDILAISAECSQSAACWSTGSCTRWLRWSSSSSCSWKLHKLPPDWILGRSQGSRQERNGLHSFLFYGLARAPCLGSAGKADANASAGASYRSELCRAQLLMWDSLRCNFGFGRGGLRASCPNSCITALLIHLGSWQSFHGHDQTSHRLARTWAVHPCWAGHWIQSWFTF